MACFGVYSVYDNEYNITVTVCIGSREMHRIAEKQTLCTFLGYLLQNLALTRISDRSVALLQTLCPVMTAIFAFILLGERLSMAGMAGAVIIIVCVLLSTIITSEKQ